MKSYTVLRNQFGSLTANTNANNLTLGDQLINDSLRYLTTKYFFNERTDTVPGGTVAGQQSYDLPFNIKTLINVYISVGDIRYQLTEAPNRQMWDSLNFIPYTSDIPQFYYIYNKKLYVFPTPASNGNEITYNYKCRIKDLSQPDYTTGGVTLPYALTFTAPVLTGAVSATLSGASDLPTGAYQITFSTGEVRLVTLTNLATTATWSTPLTLDATDAIIVRMNNGGEIVTGNGTTFTQSMVGRWLRVTAPDGDEEWYEINSYISSTLLSLKNMYQGVSVSNKPFVIGEMPILAEDYHDLPVFRACEIYYTTRVADPDKANGFKKLYDTGFEALDAEFGSKSWSVAITPADQEVNNPNLFTRSLS